MRLGRAQHLLQRRAADDLPDVGQVAATMRLARFRVAAQGDLPIFGVYDLRILAVELERRANAGEDQVGAAHAFGLQPLHPVTHTLGKHTQHVAPVADVRICWARSADEVDAGRESCRVTRTEPRAHLCGDGPRASDNPSAAGHC